MGLSLKKLILNAGTKAVNTHPCAFVNYELRAFKTWISSAPNYFDNAISDVFGVFETQLTSKSNLHSRKK